MRIVVCKGEGQITEKKSRFIGQLFPVRSESQALSVLEDVRKTFWDARHHVYAYVTDSGGVRHFSDDGEPTGTGGEPVMDCLTHRDLTGALLVVTRYFGGTLLGTGGLTRAYGAAAEAACAAAGTAELLEGMVYHLTLTYQQAGKLEWLVRESGAVMPDTEFLEKVTATVLVPASCQTAFLSRTADTFAGGVVPQELGEKRYYLDSKGKVHYI